MGRWTVHPLTTCVYEALAPHSVSFGVAVSGLEMSQNSARISWTEEELQKLLSDTMKGIHDRCVEYGSEGDHVNYLKGANIAGFLKVANAMLAYGVV